MSFLKQQKTLQGDPRGSIWWHRAGVDGAPFRGKSLPLLKEHEYEDKVERVWDCHYGIFDTTKPAQTIDGRTLQWVMDAAMSGWVKIIYRDHRWVETEEGAAMLQYVEWSEPYQELSAGNSQGTS